MNTINNADFQITGPSGNTVAIIEVKNLPGLIPSSAVDVRRGLLDSSDSPAAYFLIISQDQAFLWEPAQSAIDDAEPVASFPMRQFLREYLEEGELTRHLRGAELEIAVIQWLGDLTRGRASIAPESRIVEKFEEQIRGGTIHTGQSR